MRLPILTLSLIIFLISCCKDTSENYYEKKIIGKWNWTESTGGVTGNIHITPESIGSTRELFFYSNKSVLIIHNQDTIEKTEYFFSREKSILLGGIYDFLTINYHIDPNNTSFIYPMRYIIIELTDKKLIINEDVYDGYFHVYKKLK